jgi:hypothetical protein
MNTYLERLATRTETRQFRPVRRRGSAAGALPDGFPPTLAGVERFCEVLLDATVPYAAAVKPNMAFFEAFGSAGIAALERLRGACRRTSRSWPT